MPGDLLESIAYLFAEQLRRRPDILGRLRSHATELLGFGVELRKLFLEFLPLIAR